jgi:hypothetical protein
MNDRADDHRSLYREPLQTFVTARDAVVKALKEAGKAEEAARVKALRKPSVPAWALDQLADRDPAGVQELLDAGAEIRAAQQAALTSDRHADRLRDATAARRKIVDRLSASAADALTEAGHAATTHIDAIRATLEAASIDPEDGERLRSGTLDRAIESVGFGDMFGLHSVGDDEEPAASEPESAEVSASISKGELGRLRRDRDAAGRKAEQARESANRLSDQVEAMQQRVEELREKHAAAESRALEAELDAKRADEAYRDAEDS